VIEAMRTPATPPCATPDTIPAGPPQRRTLPETAALHSEILARLGPSPVAEDQLIRDLKRTAGEVTPELVVLEMDGHIERQAGGLLTRRA